MSNFVVGLLVYVAVFLTGGLVATGHWLVALVVVSAMLYLPFTSKAYDDVKAKRDAEERS